MIQTEQSFMGNITRATLVSAVFALTATISPQHAQAAAPDDLKEGGGICIISEITPLDFGSYERLGVNKYTSLTGVSRFTVECRGGKGDREISIDISQGISPSSGSSCSSPRRRINQVGTGYIEYAIYKDPGLTIPWGCAGTVRETVPAGGKRTFTIYAKIFANQWRGPQAIVHGRIDDNIDITVNF